MQYRITNKKNQTATLDADRYEIDGSGTRFYGENDEVIASFYDGEIISVVPAALQFDSGDES